MPKRRREGPGRGFSRRDFLKGAPLGIAAAVIGTVIGRSLVSLLGGRRRGPQFQKGSIFTPRHDLRAKG